MLNGEEPEEALRFTATRQSKKNPSDVIIDIEATTTTEETRTTRSRSQRQDTKRCLKRSMSISIAVLQRRHVRLRFQQEPAGSDIDSMETVELIPDKYGKIFRIQRANTSSDIVNDLKEIAVLLNNVDRIKTCNVSKTTKQTISKYKKPDVVNIVGGSGIHIGPEILAVNQTVVNKEIIKGRFLGLEIQSRKPNKRKEIRCGVIVFVCLSMIVSCALIHHVIKYGFLGNRPPERLDLGLTQWWYVSRSEWQAKKERNMTALSTPVGQVVIGHSETAFCTERETCIKHVQDMQRRDQYDRLWVDIGPNFLISGNGLIFEGRGANLQGSMIKNYNHLGISIMFLGDYERDQTSIWQFSHLEILLKVLVDRGVLSKTYVVLGYCQIAPPAISPGPNVMDMLPVMDHWHDGQSDDFHCVRR